MRPGNREHVSHVAMHIPRTPLHLRRPSRVQRYSSSMHRAMEEDSLMIRHDDDELYGELPVPPHATGVLETLNFCSFLYHSGILSTIIIFRP